ncbi:MAG: Tad domain-containing protein [Hyphomonadaceae bacterium]|nr:Tad domain-containing protein [Hyphomonadaceae bacterium]
MIEKFATRLQEFRTNTDGSTAGIVAMALPILIGALAVSIEAGFWMKSKTDVQLYADLAAYAGALELQTATPVNAKNYAKLHALDNGFDFSKGSITVNSPPTSGAHQGDSDALEVLIDQSSLKFFSGIVSDKAITTRVRSVAAMVTENGDDVCALALNTTDPSTINIAGSTTADLAGCDMHSNSTSSSAIAIKGGPVVTARCVSASGGIPATFSNLECDDVIENADPVVDPYASLPAPDISTKTCEANPVADSFGNIKIDPGLYCSSISVNNKLTFDKPGTYYFNNADLNIKKNALITGTGITIVLMNGSAINGLNGQAVIQVSAAQAPEPYPGVVIYSDPLTQPAGSATTFKGNTGSFFEGLLYYPNQNLSFGGNGSTSADCTMVVANKIFMSGTSSFVSTGCKANFGLDVASANSTTVIRVME